ncbi:MAG TPA: tetratricopeptide repeat protein [Rhodopila sp.]|nr:tetratricopeptide repeat protein [Rhodopila sp.]
MQYARSVGRSALLALTLLSACAASQPSPRSDAGLKPTGAVGDYLAGRFALSQGDYSVAASSLLRAAAENPGDPDMTLEAFIACVQAGRPEAVTLARQLPDSQIAQLVLADADIKGGHWPAVEEIFHGLPRQGLTQFLQPLLVAWAQAGDGRTDTALATLRPYIESARFRSIFVLHGAMIADLGKKQDEAARLFHIAQGDLTEPNLRLAQILANWQARSGQPAEAQRTLAALQTVAPDLGIAMPSMLSNVLKRPVTRAADGIAETYFTFAALLRAQDQSDFSLVILRLALDLRPDFTAARLLAADILASRNQPQAASRLLAEVPASDPILPVVRLRRATLTERIGHTDDALRDLEQMSREHPDSPLPDEQRGDILRSKRRFADAVSAYDRAISRIAQPAASDWVVFYDRGVAEEQSHQWPKAVADFKRALQLSPDQPFVLNYLGYSWADQGHHLQEARRMIELAAQRRPNDGAITDSLGWVMFRQGDYAAAVKALERAVELEPEDATINGHLGDAYWAAGRKTEAQYQWRRALTMHPAPDDAAKLEAKLNGGGGHGGAVVSNP